MGDNKSVIKKQKSILLLLIFVFLKIGVAHSLSHAFSHDDLNDCEHCILITNSNKTNTFIGDTFPQTIYVIQAAVTDKPVTLLYKNPLFREHFYVFFFNKPPPKI